ncbi:hypothetical protein AB0B25_07670 [Nocardia sp. NPDC049190]|uniref:hypothetical protein n=1 Tax=Nocardia sp. NPDC049190 TaxID=3155650 RepID=UPI0033DF3820
MGTDFDSYTARLRLDSRYGPYLPDAIVSTDCVLVAGYHAAFATPPRPGTVIAAFPGINQTAAAARGYPVMALVRVEHATQVVTVHTDGSRQINWETDPFGELPTGIGWRLTPAAADTAGRWVITDGRWAAGGCEAVLARSVTAQVPGAPAVVAVHEQDPHTRRRWPS